MPHDCPRRIRSDRWRLVSGAVLKVSQRLAKRRAPLRMMGAAALTGAALVLNCAASQVAAPTQQPRGIPHQVVFTQYTPLFKNAEIMRRLLSPIARQEVLDSLARSLEALAPYPIDLAKEKFLVYVPPGAPHSPHGFALLVWVSPWDRATLPFGWASQLDRYGVIFVAAEGAGNPTNVLSRRVPLALSAEENIVRQYPIDRERIYVGGFSGGSRVALRIALGYPDVFHGALLHAGSNALGGYPIPPRDLFLRFQSSSHIVYVTGALDPNPLRDGPTGLRRRSGFHNSTAATGPRLPPSSGTNDRATRILSARPPSAASRVNRRFIAFTRPTYTRA